jgi:hypothetical protein
VPRLLILNPPIGRSAPIALTPVVGSELVISWPMSVISEFWAADAMTAPLGPAVVPPGWTYVPDPLRGIGSSY